MYDVIVVGARCAGAATAMLLARRGQQVLMLDKDPPGSDMAHSTHFVQPIAVSKLRKWGLLPALEAVCPGFETYGFDFGSAVVRGRPPVVDGEARGFCPRRQVLDSILELHELRTSIKKPGASRSYRRPSTCLVSGFSPS